MLKIRWAFLKSLLIFTLIYIFNLPIIAKINNEINPLSLIFGIILAPIFEIYYLMSIMFFWSVDFMNFAYFILDKLLDVLKIFDHYKKNHKTSKKHNTKKKKKKKKKKTKKKKKQQKKTHKNKPKQKKKNTKNNKTQKKQQNKQNTKTQNNKKKQKPHTTKQNKKKTKTKTKQNKKNTKKQKKQKTKKKKKKNNTNPQNKPKKTKKKKNPHKKKQKKKSLIWNLLPYVNNVFLKCWFYEFCLLYFRQIVRCINRFFVSTYNKDIIKLTYCLAKHLCLIYSTISRKHIYK
nr:hypothetical protein [Mycoplasmopsis bovis]